MPSYERTFIEEIKNVYRYLPNLDERKNINTILPVTSTLLSSNYLPFSTLYCAYMNIPILIDYCTRSTALENKLFSHSWPCNFKALSGDKRHVRHNRPSMFRVSERTGILYSETNNGILFFHPYNKHAKTNLVDNIKSMPIIICLNDAEMQQIHECTSFNIASQLTLENLNNWFTNASNSNNSYHGFFSTINNSYHGFLSTNNKMSKKCNKMPKKCTNKRFTNFDIIATCAEMTTPELFNLANKFFTNISFSDVFLQSKVLINSVFIFFKAYCTYASINGLDSVFPIVLDALEKFNKYNIDLAVHTKDFKTFMMNIILDNNFDLLSSSYILKEYSKKYGKFEYPLSLIMHFTELFEHSNMFQLNLFKNKIFENIDASATNDEVCNSVLAIHNLLSLVYKINQISSNESLTLEKCPDFISYLPVINNTWREASQYPSCLCALCNFIINAYESNINQSACVTSSSSIYKLVFILGYASGIFEALKNVTSNVDAIYKAVEAALLSTNNDTSIHNIFKLLHLLNLSDMEDRLCKDFAKNTKYKAYTVETELS